MDPGSPAGETIMTQTEMLYTLLWLNDMHKFYCTLCMHLRIHDKLHTTQTVRLTAGFLVLNVPTVPCRFGFQQHINNVWIFPHSYNKWYVSRRNMPRWNRFLYERHSNQTDVCLGAFIWCESTNGTDRRDESTALASSHRTTRLPAHDR